MEAAPCAASGPDGRTSRFTGPSRKGALLLWGAPFAVPKPLTVRCVHPKDRRFP